MVVTMKRVMRSKLNKIFSCNFTKNISLFPFLFLLARPKSSSKGTGKLKKSSDFSDSEGEDKEVGVISAANMSLIVGSPKLKQKNAITSSNTSPVYICGPFNCGDNYLWVASFQHIHPWYCDAQYSINVSESLYDYSFKDKAGKYPTFITSLNEFPLREECDRGNTVVLKKGYPVKKWATVFTTSTNDRKALMKQLNMYESLRKQIYGANEKGADVATFYLNYIRQAGREEIFDRLNKFLAPNDDARSKLFNTEFHKFSKIVPEYHFNVTLDHFWTDYSIKEFVKKWYEVYSYKEVDEEVLKLCYLNYPDARKLPVWNDVVEQMLRGG